MPICINMSVAVGLRRGLQLLGEASTKPVSRLQLRAKIQYEGKRSRRGGRVCVCVWRGGGGGPTLDV